ncbi:MAG: TcpQ domain-containing protein [Rhodospirillales bacterium]|nr:TcpQ domain-containing protein [Rhodospirillales bacterium]
MTGAALAIALLALSAAPAAAGFRYVPPAETGAVRAEAIAKSPGAADIGPPLGPGPAILEPKISDPSVSGTSVWWVREGEMLRAVLARWAARAGTEVLFLTDRRYRLEGNAAFEGGFSDAVQTLFRGLSHLPHAPVAARSEGGTALVVRHRMPASPASGGKP